MVHFIEILKFDNNLISFFYQDAFRLNLLDQAEKLKDDAKNILDFFLSKGPFTADTNATDALASIRAMQNQLKELRDREATLRKDLAVFDLSVLESAEMTTLEKVNSSKS